MSHILAVASGKGGVGKTLTTAALATLLNRKGYRVLAVDADMGLRNLDLPFGVQNEVLYDVVDIMKKRCIAEEAILSLAPGLDFLAASQKKTWEKVDTPLFRKILEGLSSSYDYILIDCPPGRGLAYRSAVSAVNDILFVVEPTWSSIRDSDRIIQYCHKHHFFRYAGIFNNFYTNTTGYISPDKAQETLAFERVAGLLPHSERVNRLYLEGNILSMKDDAPYVLAMEYTLSWIIHNERVPFDKIKQTLLPDGPIDKESHCAMNKNAASPDESSVTATPIPNAAITELQKAASYVYKGKADLLSKNAYSSPHEPHTENTSSRKQGIAGTQSRISVQKRRHQAKNWRHFHR